MSANNQLVIIKKKNKFQVHENLCVDNDFESSKDSLLKELNKIEDALKFCNEYMKQEIVEYGIYTDSSCWKENEK